MAASQMSETQLRAMVSDLHSQGIKTVVMDSYYRSNLEHLAPVWETLKRDPRIEIFFSIRDDDPVHARRLEERMSAADTHILRGNRVCKVPFSGYVACDYGLHELYPLPKWKGPKIQIFHGLLNKNTFGPNMLPFDAFFMLGPYSRGKFERHVAPRHPGSRLFDIGFPKTDRILRLADKQSELKTAAGISAHRPVVLYAPTHGPYASLYRYGIHLIEKVLESDIELMVKLHPYSAYLHENNRINWPIIMTPYQEHSRFHLIEDDDSARYLAMADFLITDASSVAYEYLLLNRPLIFMDVPNFFKYEQNGNNNLEKWGRKAGEIVEGVEQLPQALMQAMAHPGHREEIRRSMVRDLFYNPGQASAAAAETIIHLVFDR